VAPSAKEKYPQQALRFVLVSLAFHLAVVGLFLALGVLVARAREPRVVRLFFCETLAGLGLQQIGYILGLLMPEGTSPHVLKVINVFGFLLGSAGGVSLAGFYPRRLQPGGRDRSAAVAVIAHLVAIPLVVIVAATDQVYYVDADFIGRRGPLVWIQVLYDLAYTLTFMGIMVHHLRRATEPLVQVRAAITLYAMLGLVGANLIATILWTEGRLFLLIITMGSALTGTILAVGIIQYRLFEAQRVFQRGLAATITSIMVAILFGVFEQLLEAVFATVSGGSGRGASGADSSSLPPAVRTDLSPAEDVADTSRRPRRENGRRAAAHGEPW